MSDELSTQLSDQRALWECLLLSGADVSDYAYETRTEEGREAGFREFERRGTGAEVVEAVRQLRNDYEAEERMSEERTCSDF